MAQGEIHFRRAGKMGGAPAGGACGEQRPEPHLYYHRVGLRVQVGVLAFEGRGVVLGRRGSGVQAFCRQAKPWRKAKFTSAAQEKWEGPPQAGPAGSSAQNPTYITTVWGYGYKWGF